MSNTGRFHLQLGCMHACVEFLPKGWTFFKNILADPNIIKKHKFWYGKIKSTQVCPEKPLFADRLNEVKQFFQVDTSFLIKYFSRYGTPNALRFKGKLISFFNGNTGKEHLKKAYENAAFDYTLRLMLGYERYSLIIDYLDFMIKNHESIEEWYVLDYGCGVSDIGLLLSTLGAKVTIADLDDKKFAFTIWRYNKRKLNFTSIAIKNTEKYPILRNKEYDLIIAVELFEHVRNPLKLLMNFTSALKNDGFLFNSMGGVFSREIVGDHLMEAIVEGSSPKFKRYHDFHYRMMPLGKNSRYLFKKIK